LAIVAAVLLGGLLFAWSGVFNVAASRGHWAIVEWLLGFVMRNSVETRSLTIATPPLASTDLITLGAAHYHGSCANCHGGPGIPIGPVVQQMLPPPPDLAIATTQWKESELFWIVKHGIKYTGMPAWASQQRDDEVWAVVAFLRRLPGLDAQSYRDLAMGTLQVARQSGRGVATTAAPEEAVLACARCHGADDRAPPSALVPILHGQSAAFLTAALRAYADGKRESGIMQPIAVALTSEDIQRVASYYAGLKRPLLESEPQQIDAAAVENGRLLATDGKPTADIPPCLPCHGADALDTYPRLRGQQASYLRTQLQLWKRGVVPRTDTAAIMAPIAQRLSDRQIEDVTAFFASEAPSSGKAARP
jgi:cytochrome c553